MLGNLKVKKEIHRVNPLSPTPHTKTNQKAKPPPSFYRNK